MRGTTDAKKKIMVQAAVWLRTSYKGSFGRETRGNAELSIVLKGGGGKTGILTQNWQEREKFVLKNPRGGLS